jgi:hypothetical protein
MVTDGDALVDDFEKRGKRVKARGPVEYDLAGMPDKQFDLLCFRLIRLEHPDAIKPKEAGDGGADVLLPKPGGGYGRAWQAKHFPNRIGWPACRKSLADAIKNYKPDRYTFCFPRDLSGTEQRTFDKHFRNSEIQIPVDFWNGSELHSRLTESDAGTTVADHFFKDDADQLEAIKRAALAKGELSTMGDALERMNPIGDFLAKKDPFYSYPAAIYEAGKATTPVASGAVMSIEQSSGGVVARVDVVPNDDEAMELFAPKGKFTLPRETYERLEDAAKRGESVTAEGVEVVFEQLPPALSEDIGKPMTGTVSIEPLPARPAPTPWDARFSAERDGVKAQLDTFLEPVRPPEGWDGCLEGSYGGLTTRFLFRHQGDSGQLGVRYQYQLNTDPARNQLRALEFLNVVAADGGTVKVVDKRDRERELTLDTGAPDDTGTPDALVAFLESIVEIEKWANIRFSIDPDSFTDANFRQVATIAATIRRGGFNGRFENAELSVPPNKMKALESGKELVIEQSFAGEVLGQEVDLGRARAVIDNYQVEYRGTESDGSQIVRLVPGTDADAKVFQQITRPARAKKPPPPPRRKQRRSRGRRRGGRSA